MSQSSKTSKKKTRPRASHSNHRQQSEKKQSRKSPSHGGSSSGGGAKHREGDKHREGEHVNMDVWHGLLPNEDTAILLTEDGDFLMRGVEKKKRGYDIILSIRWGKDILNAAIIECPEGGYEFQGDKFETVKDIIDFHQVRKRPITISGESAILERPIRRKKWELRHRMVTLGKELGSGSYGTVYKGTLELDNQKPITVAIKVLTQMTSEASNATWKEARNHKQLNHPNVVKMYGIANDYLPYYLVMEHVAGGSVDRYLEKKGEKLSVVARVQILIEAAQGLEYLHFKGLLHRDIACRNLLIDKVVKVADFGMARKSDSYKIDPNKPMNLRWLAPEVYETAIVNKATDVYAYGVTMYECFTFPYSIPYAKWKPDKVYDMVVNKGYRLKPPNLMPQQIGDLMEDCLGPEKDRPDFKTVLFCLLAYMNNREAHQRGLGLF